MKKSNRLLPLLLCILLCLTGCGSAQPQGSREISSVQQTEQNENASGTESSAGSESSAASETSSEQNKISSRSASKKNSDPYHVSGYSGSPYVEINHNKPRFSHKQKTSTKSFESYGELDSLGRCTTAKACIGQDLMPTEPRDAIGMIRPTGWHTVKYDRSVISDLYLYNRCHLIAYSLTGENANEKNLITGTRYMNVEGMEPFEMQVADYIRDTGNHVFYRVTPIFKGNNLLASGVQMEARSVEDNGSGICFNVYCYNVQPGIKINYANGESRLSSGTDAKNSSGNSGSSDSSSRQNSGNSSALSDSNSKHAQTYVLNTNTKKFHLPGCSSISSMKNSNKKTLKTTRKKLIQAGYSPCGNCNP